MSDSKWDFLKIVPGATKAAEWLEAKISDFYKLPMEIGRQQKRAVFLDATAKRKGMLAEADQARRSGVTLNSIKAKYDEVALKLSDFLRQLSSFGLGAVPIAVAIVLGGLALSIAAGITFLFRDLEQQKKLLDAIERGVLTPEEAAAMRGGLFSGLPGTLKNVGLLAVGGVILLGVLGPAMRRR